MSIDRLGNNSNINTYNTGGTDGSGEVEGTKDSVSNGVLGEGGGVPDAFSEVSTKFNSFLSTLEQNARNLTGSLNGEITPEQVAEMEADFLQLLNSIGSTPDELGELLIKFANMSRQDALDNRLQARAAARGDLEAQAENTREAAAKQLIAAVVTFVVSVVSAAVALKGAGSAVKNSGEAKQMTDQANAMNKQANSMSKDAAQTSKIATNAEKSGSAVAPQLKNQATNQKMDADSLRSDASSVQAGAQHNQIKSQTEATKTQALTQVFGAFGTAVSKGVEYSAAEDTAQGQEFAAKATEEQSNSDIAKKFMDDIEELVKSTIRFLKEMQSAETDLMANMTRV